MSQAATLPRTVPPFIRSTGMAAVFLGISLMSLASLLLELSLTRLFSVILYYHFAFLTVSIALLGLGAGGVFAYIRKDWLARWELRSIGWVVSALDSASILFGLLIVLRVPVTLQLTWKNFGLLTVIYLVSSVPFFFTGMLFSLVFARETRRIGALYAADLVGGAASCLAIVPLLNVIGGPNAVLFAAFAMAVASAIWAHSKRRRAAGLLLAMVLLALIVTNHSEKLIDIVYARGQRQTDEVLFARWNAISRIEVDHAGEAKWIAIDRDAITTIMNAPPHGWKGTGWEPALMGSPPAIANVLRPHGEFAIIGPGGGIDMLRAVGCGSPRVTGIEINPLIANTLMRGKYAEYSHHLYEIPEVTIHVNDGRSWVRNSAQSFDVIQMTLVDTWASTSAGAFALSENYLYTVEAFREYLEHLKPDGMVAITRWELQPPREALRVVSVAMEALRESGVQDSRRNFILVADGVFNNRQGVQVVVLTKRSPFTPEEEAAVRSHIARYPQLRILYTPSAARDNVHSALINSRDPYRFARDYKFNVAPVTDNSPFFFFTVKPESLFGVSHGANLAGDVGVAVLLVLLLISLFAVQFFLILPMRFATGVKPERKYLRYFIVIGLGYILVEIAFIQRFVLFLGHPTYALTVVVFLMLLSSGAGSFLSRRWIPDPEGVKVPLAVIVVLLLAYVFGLPAVLTGMVGLSLGLKLVASGVLIAPLGFAMGMPFPSGLRALAGTGEDTVEWAWAMNAASSVLGSVLAILIAIQFGLSVVLACGAAAYVLARIVMIRAH